MLTDPLTPTLVGLVLIVLLLGLLPKWMRQPEIIGYLFTGIAVGASCKRSRTA